MSKRNTFIVGISAVVLLAVGGGVYAATRNATASTTVTPQYWAKAKATQATVACLKANDKLDVPTNERSNIELNALSHLIDVPAGTNVDVKLATYTPTSVTGADYYPAKYGTYNFAMAKDSDGWRVTEFKRCY